MFQFQNTSATDVVLLSIIFITNLSLGFRMLFLGTLIPNSTNGLIWMSDQAIAAIFRVL